MYAHTARDGKPIDGDRLYMGEDGELQRVRTCVLNLDIGPSRELGYQEIGPTRCVAMWLCP